MEVVESRVELDAHVQDGETCAACVVAHDQLLVELEAGCLEYLAQTELAGADEIVRHLRDARITSIMIIIYNYNSTILLFYKYVRTCVATPCVLVEQVEQVDEMADHGL